MKYAYIVRARNIFSTYIKEKIYYFTDINTANKFAESIITKYKYFKYMYDAGEIKKSEKDGLLHFEEVHNSSLVPESRLVIDIRCEDLYDSMDDTTTYYAVQDVGNTIIKKEV